MNEEKEVSNNIQETEENKSSEETKATPEKLFTQDDVDRIVADRLARDRKKRLNDTPKVDDSELRARESRLDCREYVLDNGLPADLLNIISTDDVQAFKEKATALQELYIKNMSYPSVKDAGDISHKMLRDAPEQEIAKAFSREEKHTPRKPPQYNF